MTDPIFRMVCPAAALAGAPEGWVGDMLRDGELALVVDDGGIAAIDAVAHTLGALTVQVVRTEADTAAQEHTVMAYAAAMPLVWIAPGFGDATRAWAHDRGPMTLLVEVDAALPEDERRRIERFVALLGRQAE